MIKHWNEEHENCKDSDEQRMEDIGQNDETKTDKNRFQATRYGREVNFLRIHADNQWEKGSYCKKRENDLGNSRQALSSKFKKDGRKL